MISRFKAPLTKEQKAANKAKKAMEKEVDAAFSEHGNRIQFNIMDLPKIHKAGMDAGRAGASIVEAVKAAIEQYRIKD